MTAEDPLVALVIVLWGLVFLGGILSAAGFDD